MWASQITPKISIANSPYLLVYGKEATLPMHLHINTFTVASNVEYNETSPVQAMLCQLLQLEEWREKVVASIHKSQQSSKINFDQRSSLNFLSNISLFFSRIKIDRILPCTQSLNLYGLTLNKFRKSWVIILTLFEIFIGKWKKFLSMDCISSIFSHHVSHLTTPL